jgi:hypothetical protein
MFEYNSKIGIQLTNTVKELIHLLDNQAKKGHTLSPLTPPVIEEIQTAGTTPNDTNAIKNMEPEFDLTGTVLNDYN